MVVDKMKYSIIANYSTDLISTEYSYPELNFDQIG